MRSVSIQQIYFRKNCILFSTIKHQEYHIFVNIIFYYNILDAVVEPLSGGSSFLEF